MSLHNSHGFQYVKQLQINNESLRLESSRLRDLLEKSEALRVGLKEEINQLKKELKVARAKKGMKWSEEIKHVE